MKRRAFGAKSHAWLEANATVLAVLRRELARLSREFPFYESQLSAFAPQARGYGGQVSVAANREGAESAEVWATV